MNMLLIRSGDQYYEHYYENTVSKYIDYFLGLLY